MKQTKLVLMMSLLAVLLMFSTVTAFAAGQESAVVTASLYDTDAHLSQSTMCRASSVPTILTFRESNAPLGTHNKRFLVCIQNSSAHAPIYNGAIGQ